MSLFNRCKHRWVETGRKVRPHAESFKFGGGFWAEEYSDLVYGYTIISLRCSECGDVKTKKLRGELVGGSGTKETP